MTGYPCRFPASSVGSDVLRHVLIPLIAAILLAAAPPAHAGAPSPLWPLLDPEWTRQDPALHADRGMELTARKIGQMILVGFPGTAPDQKWPRRVRAMIAEGRIGGVLLFGHNIRGPKQVRRLTGAIGEAGGRLPPIIAVDQEGGYIQRLNRRKGFTRLASARSIAKTSPCEAWAAYARTAAELASLNINTNLGPVVDLNINPRSPAIGRLGRTYGVDPEVVVSYAEAFIGAHAAAGVFSAAKHFPGHGSAVRDPHKRVVDITETWQPSELESFRALAGHHDVAMIMVGHLIHPRFSDGDRPTSLSRRAITVELRDRLGYDGLIVTDDLGMDAITERYGTEDSAVMAVGAGADLLIFANQRAGDNTLVDRVIATLTAEVAAGRLPESAINDSYERILAAKARLAARFGTAASGPGAEPSENDDSPAERIIAGAPPSICPGEPPEDTPG